MTEQSTLQHCRQTIRRASLSFTLASWLFDGSTRDGVHLLYGWCRYCDDQLDENCNLRLQEERLLKLRAQTERALAGGAVAHPAFHALQLLVWRHGIDPRLVRDLIDGMEMDLRKERYWTVEELGQYAYRVAGTIGLMMCRVMGLTDERAVANAIDLGVAMQFTNVARDVVQDAQAQRVYLPLNWLDEAGVPDGHLDRERHRQKIAGVAARLLDAADGYYRSGNAALRYLKPRCAFAVAVASRVYQVTGDRVRARGARAWDSQTVLSRWDKTVLVVEALGMVAATSPHRLWRRVTRYRHNGLGLGPGAAESYRPTHAPSISTHVPR
jgi:phytoene synthase